MAIYMVDPQVTPNPTTWGNSHRRPRSSTDELLSERASKESDMSPARDLLAQGAPDPLSGDHHLFAPSGSGGS